MGRALDLEIFEDAFEHRVPNDSGDRAQSHFDKVTVHYRYAVAAVGRARLRISTSEKCISNKITDVAG